MAIFPSHLHFEDVKNLLGVLHRLVDQCNTMIDHDFPDCIGAGLDQGGFS